MKPQVILLDVKKELEILKLNLDKCQLSTAAINEILNQIFHVFLNRGLDDKEQCFYDLKFVPDFSRIHIPNLYPYTTGTMRGVVYMFGVDLFNKMVTLMGESNSHYSYGLTRVQGTILVLDFFPY